MTSLVLPFQNPAGSPFASADVCRQAGLTLPDEALRPLFDDDLWDFTDVAGLPVSMGPNIRRLSFTQITDPRWRLAAKELIFAMLVPRHEAVAPLPRAHRTPVHVATACRRLGETARFLNWLTGQGVDSLGEVSTRHCEAYLAHRRHVTGEDGTVVGERSPGTRRAAAQAVIDLVNYRELFTADRPDPGLRPWGGATATAIAEMPSGRSMNKTQPLSDDVLQPMLAAALPSRAPPPAGPLPAAGRAAAHASRARGQRTARGRMAARRPAAPGQPEHPGPPGRHQPVQPPVAR